LIGNFQTKAYIPSFVFWISSIFLGLFQKHKKQEDSSLVLGLAFLSLSTALLMLYTSNDPGIRAIETWGLICQLIILVLFPLFIIRNFNGLIKLNLPIYKVVDKPQFLPTYILFIGVLILGSAFVFALNGGAYHQMTAAKYNADGELAQILKDPFLAEINYKQGLIHSKLNAKSNTSLARIAYQENKIEELAK
jgi:D-alanyl-lipoteichoic acid acyltransferase DltB (MBOAT superfamily)